MDKITDIAETYRKLTNELLLLRETNDISEGLEDWYQERLDGLWTLMTEEEREEFETDLANGQPIYGPGKIT